MTAPFYNNLDNIGKKLGGLGAIIGHELFHSVDHHSIGINEHGLEEPLLTKNDIQKYHHKLVRIKQHFNQYKIHNHNVDVEQTVGENIGDLGGLQLAVDTLKTYKGIDYKKELKDLFTQWAVIWRSKMSRSVSLDLLKNDVHSPNEIRVNAILTLMDEFYEVFDIPENSKMYTPPEKRFNIFL